MADALQPFQDRVRAILDAFRPAMQVGADLIEPAALDGAHDTIRGMSGATFASVTAYVADQEDDGTPAIVAAYNAAAGRLAGFTGHDGQPFLIDVAGPADDQTWIVLT